MNHHHKKDLDVRRSRGLRETMTSRRDSMITSLKNGLCLSPVLSNAPNGHGKGKGMPISCFLTYVPDTLEGLIDHTSELRWLSVYGGGVGGHWSDVRTVSDVALVQYLFSTP